MKTKNKPSANEVFIEKNLDKNIPINLIYEQISHIEEIIYNTVLSVQEYNKNEIFSNNDTNMCIQLLFNLSERSKEIRTNSYTSTIDDHINNIQRITDDLNQIISKYGTKYMKDVFYICFGTEFEAFICNDSSSHTQCNQNSEDLYLRNKLKLIEKYTHPIGFKMSLTKNIKKNSNSSTNEEMCMNKETDEAIIIDFSPQFECFDVEITDSFFRKINEIKIVVHSKKNGKTVVISALIDNINIDFFSNKYVEKRKELLIEGSLTKNFIDLELLKRQIDTMCIKDILVYGDNDIYKKNINIQKLIHSLKEMKLEIVTKKFVALDIFTKRNQILDMLLYKDNEIQYLSYLLYDLLTKIDTDNDDFSDSSEQIEIYNSFSWRTKSFFKDAMKNTAQYNQNILCKYENTAISIEQQIIFWRVPDNIKERAFIKLKEFKGKMDDSGSKAKQNLEGLLKIHFESCRREPVLEIVEGINNKFLQIIEKNENNLIIPHKKPKYTNIEIQNYYEKCILILDNNMKNVLEKISIKELKSLIGINTVNNSKKKDGSHKQILITQFLNQIKLSRHNTKSISEILIQNIINSDTEKSKISKKSSQNQFTLLKQLKYHSDLADLSSNIDAIKNMIHTMRNVLDESIHGHAHAKNQIMKIIGQWMNGSQSGYCFGFEGSPGIGKTSLAKKGLAKCLTDEDGSYRPFSFIALGGSCNGSTLEGHSYTYLNSTWGRIADILIESKCMNPIIYIDELDKVSKSEHGKEIIGILTHLIDSTQNDNFQDKYFSGIPLDLSKALFIFSYNDVEQIDRVLLDRIHRIKFDNLTLQEKIVIVSKYILPDINEKMGFHDIIRLDDNIITFIIENYTSEPGVRKLKEILFDLYGEINIELLEGNSIHELPIHIRELDLERYLNKYRRVTELKIHKNNTVGVMNGLWANSLGNGGIIPIETMYFPSELFLELKLTGLQGDVMKESMNVAKTLVWSLCTSKQKTFILKNLKNSKTQGIHIHCPEGSVSKDGPSAGAAIVTSIFSLLNNIPIKHNVAMTGEISLQGNITAIGGLEQKITGGIRAGIIHFLFPEENLIDFKLFLNKMTEQQLIKNESDIIHDAIHKKYMITISEKEILCTYVSTISEVFPHVFL